MAATPAPTGPATAIGAAGAPTPGMIQAAAAPTRTAAATTERVRHPGASPVTPGAPFQVASARPPPNGGHRSLRPEDRRGIEQLYRRTLATTPPMRFGFAWDWARRNPARAAASRRCTCAKARPIVASRRSPGQSRCCGHRSGAWSGDPLVVAERQRQGLGESLLRAWDRESGVALGAACRRDAVAARRDALAEAARALPGQAVEPARLPQPSWPVAINRLVSAVAVPVVKVVAQRGRLREEVEVVRRFDRGVDRLWERLAPRFDLAVRRDAAYLNWKFIEPPHVRYSSAVLSATTRPRLRRVSAHARAAGPGHADRRLARRSVRRARPEDAAALGRSRGAGGRTRTRFAVTSRTRSSAACSGGRGISS